MELTSLQRVLADTMSDISESHWCAGWMAGTEFALWDAIVGVSTKWGISEISEQNIAKLKELSSQVGGWIIWDEEQGETFVPMEDWLKIHAERQ